jgi:hypothetical protein
MLEYCKVILESVSFDHTLFLKELRKASTRLHKPEAEEYYNETFGGDNDE